MAIFSLLVTCARAQDKAHVSAIIDGKKLQFAPEIEQKLATDFIILLENCRDASVNDGNTNQPRFQDAEKHSHLTIIFAKRQSVEVPNVEAKVEVDEMVVTLPLSSGVIWVHSDQDTSHFAKWSSYDTYQEIQRILKDAQKPVLSQ